MAGPADRALEVARESGLIEPRAPLLVLLSGGADSVCLLDVAVELGAQVEALHLNYGLRVGADGDEALCRELCERLGVPLRVEPVRVEAVEGVGNVQAEARELRYAHAERWSREREGADYAAAHTLSDQAETVIYRLATSPGRRALLGMEPRRGSLVRPLLEATRDDTRAWCRERGLEWREDPSNEDPRFARARVRHEALPVLRELNPAAERTIADTARQLRDEAEVLDSVAREALARLGGAGVPVADLRAEPRALARLVLRRMAEEAAAGQRSLSPAEADAVLALGQSGGTKALDLGGGLRALVEYGVVRFTAESEAVPPAPVRLLVPGSARFGAWEVEARLDASGEAVLAADELGAELVVRPWRDGDRMQPTGVGGTKTLQDLFTDRKVPRELRRMLPVVESRGQIVWVAGVAVDARFSAPGNDDGETVSLTARRVAG